jgi:hypothetical protein
MRLKMKEELEAEGILPNSKNSDIFGSGDSESHEEGKVRDSKGSDSNGEDLFDVDTSIDDLVEPERQYPPTIVFGKSPVSKNTIKFYEEQGYFPAGAGRAPAERVILEPRPNKVVVFNAFFIVGV